MRQRMKGVWIILSIITALTGLFYLWNTLFPGPYNPKLWEYFTFDQAQQGRIYHQFLRIIFIGDFFVQGTFLVWFVMSKKAQNLAKKLEDKVGLWGSVIGFAFLLWFSLLLLSFPFRFAGDYYWQTLWGFSNQPVASWLGDYLLEASLNGLFTIVGALLFLGIYRRWPVYWWFICALALSFWFVVQSFLWPIVVAPLFNQFKQSQDPQLMSMVRELSDKTGVPIQEILIMDASRQTNKANAYFSGLGKTKRIVLYDNLLANYPLDEIKAVVAHEIAHWQRSHIVKGILLGMTGTVLLCWLLALMLKGSLRSDKGQASLWAEVTLWVLMISFLSSPVQNYFSRSMENEADHDMVALIGDLSSCTRLQVDLAVKNLADIAPAPFIAWFENSHPTALQRIENIQSTGRLLGLRD